MASKTLLTINMIEDPISSIKPMVDLAALMNAHINIVVVGVMMPPPSTIYGAIPNDFNNEVNIQTHKDLNGRVNELEKLVQNAGVSASIVAEQVDRGMIASTISNHALYADLAVFTVEGVLSKDTKSQSFNGALFDTGRPVLMLGEGATAFPKVTRVLIAWDTSPQASRAIHHALPYLDDAEEVHIAIVDPSASDGPHPGDDMAAFLARNDLKVTVDRVASCGKEIARVLLERATDLNADLIVMGGYGHSRLREKIFGGTTHTMLGKAGVTLLMAN